MPRVNMITEMVLKGKSNKDLAEAINVTSQFISDLRRGKKNASTETWLKISEELGVSVDYLIKVEQ